MIPLTDKDKMPWGVHKGKSMEDIPCRYFHWLWTEYGKNKQTTTCPVAAYIKASLPALKKEDDDAIW